MEWVRRTAIWGGRTVAVLSLLVLAAQLRGSPGWFFASIQALTPMLVPLVVLALIGSGTVRDRPGTAANLVALIGLGIFLVPLATSPSGRAAAPESVDIRVASVNLLDTNDRIDDAVDDVGRVDPDIVGFVEVTESIGRILAAHPAGRQYPYQISLPGSGPKRGRVLWSKFPVVGDAENSDSKYVLSATATTPDGPLRVVVTHIPSPFKDTAVWLAELDRLPSLVASSDLPTVVMGDFNASYMHPPFRSMMSKADLIDALPAAGKRFTMTWPNDTFLWRFVALDHVLVTPDVAVVDGTTFDVTGSDHTGVVATIAAT